MPVFHTKVIESILDPVASQLSQLVIMYEEARDKQLVPDIARPVDGVQGAVANLIAVGKQTLVASKDEQLKRDMPPTFDTVDSATQELKEASTGFEKDPQCETSRNHLLNGSRGILNGMSKMLLVLDQSEVRKIIKNCSGVREYVKVAEHVESVEEVSTFEKNLTPGLTSTLKQVDARTSDLTNLSHAAKLGAECELYQRSLPLLASAMRAFAQLRQTRPASAGEAQENRNFIMAALDSAMGEIIRVLQLTSPSEEMGALAEATSSGGAGERFGGALPGTIVAKLYQARQLLAESESNPTSPEVAKARYQATAALLEQARDLAAAMQPADRDEVLRLADEIQALNEELRKLEESGQGDSERAKEIRRLLAQKMDALEAALRKGLARQIVQTFKDPLGPLNALTEAATAPADAPNREENYKQKKSDFREHAFDMADTATALAKSGLVTDKAHADELVRTSKKVTGLAPQVIHASKALYDNPGNQEVKEHYTLMKEEYQRQVQKLVKLVDGGTDAADFIRASEEQLKADLDRAKKYIQAESNPQAAFESVASAARTANRVVTVTQSELENTEDKQYSEQLQQGSEAVGRSIHPMVTSAKSSITQPKNKEVFETFSSNADKLVESVKNIGDVIDRQQRPPTPPPERPALPEAPPERPPPPEEEEEEEPTPDVNENPIAFSAHQLLADTKTWEEKENEMVSSAKRMARLMMQMSQFARGEGGDLHSKKDLIMTARQIAKESEEIVKMARLVAESCTDKRLKRSILQVVDKIPTISTQLKIIATVKATRSGDDPESDREATEMLTDNAQNLMKAVSEVLYSTEAASIRVPPDSPAGKLGLRWIKRHR
nr:vinculin [Halisarca dujardinii]